MRTTKAWVKLWVSMSAGMGLLRSELGASASM